MLGQERCKLSIQKKKRKKEVRAKEGVRRKKNLKGKNFVFTNTLPFSCGFCKCVPASCGLSKSWLFNHEFKVIKLLTANPLKLMCMERCKNKIKQRNFLFKI